MSWLDGLSHRLRRLLDPGAFERELREEMQFHEELDAAQLGDARRARGRFGNRTYYQEETRQMTWLGSLDAWRQDLGSAWRSVRREPAFTFMVVATLVLGIGVNAATFDLLDRLYLRPPAGVARPDDLHRVWIGSGRYEGRFRSSQAMNFPMARELMAAAGDSSRIAVLTRYSYRLGATRKGPEVEAHYTTANYFALLGVTPALGRFYTMEEAQPNSDAQVIVISDRLWRQHFGADPDVVGRVAQLGTKRMTVIGVTPPGFDGIELEPTKLWAPIGAVPQSEWLKGRLFESPRMHIFHAMTRMESPDALAQFRQRATQRIRVLDRAERPNDPDTLLQVQTGAVVAARGPGERTAELKVSTRLSVVGILVLLIAAANVVNLLLARATRRKREFAVRLALGISRGRLMRLLTLETLLLALIAAIAAMFVGWFGGKLLRTLLLPEIAWADSLVHWRVLLFTLLTSLAAGVIAGIIPAIQFSRPTLTRELKEGARDGGVHHSRLRNGLLVAQAAFSVVLLAAAALFTRSLQNVRGMDIGFDAAHVIYARIAFDPGHAPAQAIIGRAYVDLEKRIEQRPGIDAVARAGLEPMKGFSFYTFYWGADSSQGIKGKYPVVTPVSRRYFTALGLRMLRGQTFDQGSGAANQVVVNEPMARMLWPARGLDVVGECIRLERRDATCHMVVGVVETARRDKIIEEPAPQFYLALGTPTTRPWGEGETLIVRASEAANAPAMREISNSLRDAFPSGDPVITTMSESLEPQYRPWKLGAQLFGGLSALALVVALVGMYSSVSYVVSQRTHEFGVRVALGASVRDLMNQVVGEGLRVVALGALLGVVLALAAGRLIATMLFGVEPSDVSAMMLAAGTLIIVAVLALAIPGWRAAHVNPSVALRQ